MSGLWKRKYLGDKQKTPNVEFQKQKSVTAPR